MRCNILNKIYKYLTRNSLKEFIEVFTNVYLLLEKCKKLDLFLKYGKLMNQSYIYMYVYYVYNWQDWRPIKVSTITYFVALKRWQSFSTKLSHWRSFWIKENRYLETISMSIINLGRNSLSLITCMKIY